MLKLFSAISFFLCLSVVSLAQVITDCRVEGLKGKVKTLREEVADLKGEPGQWKEINRDVANTFAWDRRGYQIERVMFGTNPLTKKSEPLIKIVSSYDAKRRLQIEKSYNVHKPDPNNRPPTIVMLDANGKPKAPPPPRSKAPDGAIVNEVVYKFDANHTRLEKLHYEDQAKQGKLLFRQIFNLDEKGRLKEELFYKASSEPTEKIIYSYDDQGNEIEKLVYDGKGKNISRETYSDYKFDAQGNWIQRIKHMEHIAAYNQRTKTSVITYRNITYWQ